MLPELEPLNSWDEDDFAIYIVDFLLVIDCWMIVESVLTQMSDLDEGETTFKIGFTWHTWILPNELCIKVFELILKKENPKCQKKQS